MRPLLDATTPHEFITQLWFLHSPTQGMDLLVRKPCRVARGLWVQSPQPHKCCVAFSAVMPQRDGGRGSRKEAEAPAAKQMGPQWYESVSGPPPCGGCSSSRHAPKPHNVHEEWKSECTNRAIEYTYLVVPAPSPDLVQLMTRECPCTALELQLHGGGASPRFCTRPPPN